MSFLSGIVGRPSLVQLPSIELENLFPFPMGCDDFVDLDVEVIYERILTDVLERSDKVPEHLVPLLWDNCVMSDKPEGLVTLLVQAMVRKQRLFLVYDRSVDVVYKADPQEQVAIERGFKERGHWKEGSKTGAFISFEKRRIVDLVRLYSGLEYAALGSFWKSMNLSKAIQLKVDQLRASVANHDSEVVIAQARTVAAGLGQGRPVLVDSKDVIDTAKPDMTATNSALEMINQRRSFYLKLPASYLIGVMKGSLSDTGTADSRAVDRGLRTYFYSIIKPLFKVLFEIDLRYVPDETSQLSAGLDAVRTFEIISDDLVSMPEKRQILARLFGLSGTWKPPAREPVQEAVGAPSEKTPV